MTRSEAAKDAFAKKVATQIWLEAARYLGGEGSARPNGVGTAVEEFAGAEPENVEAYILRHGGPMPLDKLNKLVPPRARTWARRAETFVAEAIPGGGGEGADILKHLTGWAERRDGPRMTALLGDFGMGKTVTCQMLTQQLLERRKAAPNGTPLPIYLDLREIRDAKSAGSAELETLMADMLRRVGEAALDPRQVIRYARETGALVIFDGLDEVTNRLTASQAEALYRTILRIVPDEDWAADRETRRTSEFLPAANDARSLRSARDDKQVQAKPRKGPLLLVSCRTHYFPDIATQRAFLVDKDRAGLDASADVEIWFMLPFNNSQVESYLRQNLGEADGARALEMIGATYNLEELSTRPILLRFFSETFRDLEEEKLKGATMGSAPAWETREDINAAVRAAGSEEPSRFQLERWRNARLLPPARQLRDAYRGSSVEYPPGTARQTVRLMELLRDNETFKYVGWELWWEGFEVGEEYWKPKLQDAATSGDLGITKLKPLVALWRSGEGDEDETVFETLQRQIPASALAPQIARRLSAAEMAAYLRILAHVAGAKFSKFDDEPHPESLSEYEIVVSGLDIENSGNYERGPPGKSKPKPDEVFGQNMNFIQVLPGVLRVMAQTLRRNTLSDALKFPLEELLAARDDVCGALAISRDFYEATKWIYGNRAFGMRLAAGLSRSAASQRGLLVLGFTLLRRSRYPFISSDQIAALARQAAAAKRDILRLKEIAKTNPLLAH
jgi:hypothetical protein